jgi:hypothetical protein
LTADSSERTSEKSVDLLRDHAQQRSRLFLTQSMACLHIQFTSLVCLNPFWKAFSISAFTWRMSVTTNFSMKCGDKRESRRVRSKPHARVAEPSDREQKYVKSGPKYRSIKGEHPKIASLWLAVPISKPSLRHIGLFEIWNKTLFATCR